MKIITIHNYYQNRGGEDQLFEDEGQLLESKGHAVLRFTKNSADIKDQSLIKVALETIWSRSTARELRAMIRRFQPDVIHSVNTFPLFSPSVFHCARKENIPFVATIQNYRYFCAQSMCFRNGKSCELCLGKLPWRAVTNRCYKGSLAGSAVVATMQTIHRQLQSWQNYIDLICVASEFSKQKLIKAGLNEDQMVIKPNFAPVDPGMGKGTGKYAIFVGRLANEKGIRTLVDAWKTLVEKGVRIPLKVVGDGPARKEVQQLSTQSAEIEWLGHVPNQEVYRLVGEAACLIFPSTGYESLPKTLIESMAVGTPVIGSNIGSIPEIVHDGETGLLFDAGDHLELARQAEYFFQQPDKIWRSTCRQQFLDRFTPDANYNQLISIYHEAIRRRHANVSKSVEATDTQIIHRGI